MAITISARAAPHKRSGSTANHQFAARLPEAPLYVFTPYAFRSGIGSVLALANALLQASAAGRTFVVDSSVYTNHFVATALPERGHECLFRPVSTCTLADAFPELPPVVAANATN